MPAGQAPPRPPIAPPAGAPGMYQAAGNFPPPTNFPPPNHFPPPGNYPPPMMMPPMMMPPPPPQRGGFARAIFMTLATSIFGFSLAANVYLLLYSGLSRGSDGLEQNVLVKGDVKQTVAVLRLSGIIDDAITNQFHRLLSRVEQDENVKALVVEIDTPGGGVTSSDEIYHLLDAYRVEHKIPVVVAMGGMATSGGYYVSCAADYIIAERTTITGNIGVLLSRYNLSQLADKWGIEDSTLHSTGSDFKSAGSMFKAETPEERAYWQTLIDDAYVTFKDVVTTGRGQKLKAPMSEVANGKAYTAAQAVSMGLVDELGYPDDAYMKAASMASLSNMHVVRFEPSVSFLSLLGAQSNLHREGKGVQINGINVNVGPQLLHELSTPRLLYLWRGQ
jgi:protease-4